MNIESYGMTNIGLVREKNEDFLCYNNDKGIFIIADGMGGHSAGELASKIASEESMQTLSKNISEELKGSQVGKKGRLR